MSTPEQVPESTSRALPTLSKVAPSAGRWAIRITVTLFVAAALYVLSIGPAFLLNKRGVIAPQTLEMTYMPLFLMGDIPGLNALIEKYIMLWIGPEPPH